MALLALAVGFFDMRQVIHDIWHLTPDMLYLTFDTWHLTVDTRHVKHDTLGGSACYLYLLHDRTSNGKIYHCPLIRCNVSLVWCQVSHDRCFGSCVSGVIKTKQKTKQKNVKHDKKNIKKKQKKNPKITLKIHFYIFFLILPKKCYSLSFPKWQD